MNERLDNLKKSNEVITENGEKLYDHLNLNRKALDKIQHLILAKTFSKLGI